MVSNPMPKMRNPTPSGNKPLWHNTHEISHNHPRLARAHPIHGHNQLHRGHRFRHKRKPWYVPDWLYQMQLAQMEEQMMMSMEMGGLSGGGGGTAMMEDDSGLPSGGDYSDLELPQDQSTDWQNSLTGGSSPDLAHQHDKKHKHHHKKKRGGEGSMQGRYNGQDEGISGGNDASEGGLQSSPQAGGYSGGFSGQSPISQQAMNYSMQPRTYGGVNRMDNLSLGSTDTAMSDDMESIGPYDQVQGSSETSTDSVFQSLSDPSFQPNPWGFGSG